MIKKWANTVARTYNISGIILTLNRLREVTDIYNLRENTKLGAGEEAEASLKSQPVN